MIEKTASKVCVSLLFAIPLHLIIDTKKTEVRYMKSNHTLLNDAQLQLLDLMSVLNTEDEFDGLRKVITEYLGNRLKN